MDTQAQSLEWILLLSVVGPVIASTGELVAWVLHPFDAADPDLARMAADTDLLAHEQRHVTGLTHRLDHQVEVPHPHRGSRLTTDHFIELRRVTALVHAPVERLAVLIAAPLRAPVTAPRR